MCAAVQIFDVDCVRAARAHGLPFVMSEARRQACVYCVSRGAARFARAFACLQPPAAAVCSTVYCLGDEGERSCCRQGAPGLTSWLAAGGQTCLFESLTTACRQAFSLASCVD